MNFMKKIPSGIYALICALLIALIAVKLVPAVMYFSCNKQVKNLEKLTNGKATEKVIKSMLPAERFDDISDDIDDILEEIKDEYSDSNVKLKVVGTVAMTDSEVDQANDEYGKKYDVEVTDGKYVCVEYSGKMDGEEGTGIQWIGLGKVDGKWCFLNLPL
ncbi:MAG: hypothetical protein MJ132_03315 [Clostridia bacterium]|nr:hypothetical protein [Clostridia bacterium]